MSTNGQNVTPAAPARITKSVLQNAAFAAQMLEGVMGLNIVDVLDGRITAPDTFTRPQMERLAIEVGDKYYRDQYLNKRKSDKGLARVARQSGTTVAALEEALANPPRLSRFGVLLTKPTKVSCKGLRDGEMFEPKAFTAPDGQIHYHFTYLIDDLREVDRKMGRAQFLARVPAVEYVDPNVKNTTSTTAPTANAVDDSDSEDQTDE